MSSKFNDPDKEALIRIYKYIYGNYGNVGSRIILESMTQLLLLGLTFDEANKPKEEYVKIEKDKASLSFIKDLATVSITSMPGVVKEVRGQFAWYVVSTEGYPKDWDEKEKNVEYMGYTLKDRFLQSSCLTRSGFLRDYVEERSLEEIRNILNRKEEMV